MTALNCLSLTQINELRRRDEFDPAALLAACLERIATREDTVQAFEYIDPQKLGTTPRTSSLLGSGLEDVPFGVKDLMDTYDMPTGWGSPIYQGRQAGRDAGCVSTLRACAAVVVGKMVTTEFACFNPGKTRNPWNPSHTPGGSSQGSAAAVADGMLPFALGTQTAASIIRPASYCGVVGYKSSRHAFDLGGVCSLSPSLDSLGFFARDVRDMAIIRRAVMRDDNPGEAVKPMRIAVVRTPHWHESSPHARQVVEHAARLLDKANVVVEEAQIGPADGALTEAHKIVMAYETARSRMFEYTRHRDLLSASMAGLIETGLSLSADEYRRAISLARTWTHQLDNLLAGFDFLITPSAAGEAPAGLDSTGDPLFSRMWTLLGAPAINLPAGNGPTGLPIGIQLIGRSHGDDALIAHATWLQSAMSSQAGEAARSPVD